MSQFKVLPGYFRLFKFVFFNISAFLISLLSWPSLMNCAFVAIMNCVYLISTYVQGHSVIHKLFLILTHFTSPHFRPSLVNFVCVREGDKIRLLFLKSVYSNFFEMLMKINVNNNRLHKTYFDHLPLNFSDVKHILYVFWNIYITYILIRIKVSQPHLSIWGTT